MHGFGIFFKKKIKFFSGKIWKTNKAIRSSATNDWLTKQKYRTPFGQIRWTNNRDKSNQTTDKSNRTTGTTDKVITKRLSLTELFGSTGR